MPGTDQGNDSPKTVEDLTKALEALQTKYDNLDTAHTKVKDDLRVLKASTPDTAKLQKDLDAAISEKSRILQEVDVHKNALKEFKSNIAQEKLKTEVTTALGTAGATKHLATALKLFDMKAEGLVDENGNVVKSSIDSAIETLKTSDGSLFEVATTEALPATMVAGGGIKVPPLKHAQERLTQSGFETELAKAVATGKQSAIDKVVADFAVA